MVVVKLFGEAYQASTGIPSAFASILTRYAIVPSSSFIVFAEAVQAVTVLCSVQFVNLSEEEKARVLSSQFKASQL